MKQVFVQHGTAMIAQVPAPMIEETGILVEVAYSLISTGTELTGLRESGKSITQQALEQPEKIKKAMDHLRRQGIRKTIAKIQGKAADSHRAGYSCSGVVVQVGKEIHDIQPGERVACAGAGIANHAEIVLVPRNLVVKIPDDCGLREAASTTVGSIAMQGVRRADPRLGEHVAVIGLGLLGQITVMLLKAAGCIVTGIELNPRRIEIAGRVGMDYGFSPVEADIQKEINRLTGDHGVDATIITAASESDDIAQQAMEITRKKGRVVVVGAVGLGLKRSPFYEKEIDFLISSSYGPGRYDDRYERKGRDYPYAYVRWTENRNMQEYLRLLAEGKVNLDLILEKEYALEDVERAYHDLASAQEPPLGVLLTYGLDAEKDARDEKLATKVTLSEQPGSGKIGVALIGAGNFAKAVHIPNLQKLSHLYELRAVVSRSGANARKVAEQYGFAYASTDIADVLEDEHVDMVLICTRHNLHAKLAIQAARAGKAIFLEKPMAMNAEELKELEAVLREAQVPFMVGYNRRFSPAAIRAREILDTVPGPSMMLYRVNAGHLPANHWTQTEEGGGRIIGEACHMFDLMQYFVHPARVVEVTSLKIPSAEGSHAPSDNLSATVQYDDGSIGTLVYTSLGASDLPKEYVEIHAGGKALVIDDFLSLHVHGSAEQGWESRTQDKGHERALEQFGGFLKGGEAELVSLDNLLETAEISNRIA